MILLFEDNHDLAYIMKRIISSILGKSCLVCSKKKDAENEVFSGNVDVIVSDISIYGRNEGIDFIRKIRKVMPFTCPPIVVYTGINIDSKEFSDAEGISDAVYEKGETSIVELCNKIKKILVS
jgi:CheY-like chemotaxis protein